MQAFKDHKIVDHFYRPGECDLTANVDFAHLKEAIGSLGECPRRLCLAPCSPNPASPAQTHGPITQADFLNRMGLPLRVAALIRNAQKEERKKAIERATARLVDPLGMGREYRVLGITSLPVDGKPVWPFP